MSWQAYGWAMRQEGDLTSTAKFVLVVIADQSDPYGVAEAGRELLAEVCCCSPSAVSANLGRLEDAGFIRRVRRGKLAGRMADLIVLAPTGERGQMEPLPDDHSLMGSQTALEPQSRDSQRRESGVGYREKPPVEVQENDHSREVVPGLRISGRPVKRSWWELACSVLDEFNAAAETSLSALTGAGMPSEAAKRIYLRVRAWPELTIEQHRDIIGRTLASRWWGKGDPSVGVVYGPKVFEENMTRQPPPADAKKERAQRGLAAIQRLIDQRAGA